MRPRRLAPLALLIAAATALTACGDDDTQAAAGDESATHVVTHAEGETEVPDDPQRIAVLWRPTLSALVDLGFDPVASGAETPDGSDLAAFLPEGHAIDDLQLVGTAREPDIEALAGADPDLIITADVDGAAETYDSLTQIAPTVSLTWEGTGSWRTHLDEVAGVLQVPERAAEVVATYDERVQAVSDAVGDPSAVEVSLVRVQAADVLRLETPESFPGQVLADVGFGRPATQVQPDPDRDFIEISLELIPEADGDVVFVLANGDNTTARETIRSSALWQNLPAAQRGDVVDADYTVWGSSTYRGAHGILDDVEAALTQ